MHPKKKKKKRGCFPCPLLLSLSTLVSTACFLSAEEGEAEKGGEREGGACKTQTSLEKLEKSAPALRQIAEAQAKVCCRKRFRFLSAPLCWRMINKDFILFFFPLLIVTTCELQMEGLGREKKKFSVVVFPRPPPAAWLHFSLPPCAFSRNIWEISDPWLLQGVWKVFVSQQFEPDRLLYQIQIQPKPLWSGGGKEKEILSHPFGFLPSFCGFFFTLPDVLFLACSDFHWIFCRVWVEMSDPL